MIQSHSLRLSKPAESLRMQNEDDIREDKIDQAIAAIRGHQEFLTVERWNARFDVSYNQFLKNYEFKLRSEIELLPR